LAPCPESKPARKAKWSSTSKRPRLESAESSLSLVATPSVRPRACSRCSVSARPGTGVAAAALPASKTAVMRRVKSATSPAPPSSASQQAASSSLLALAMMELPAKVSLTGS
jgi:hypothetical protein